MQINSVVLPREAVGVVVVVFGCNYNPIYALYNFYPHTTLQPEERNHRIRGRKVTLKKGSLFGLVQSLKENLIRFQERIPKPKIKTPKKGLNVYPECIP